MKSLPPTEKAVCARREVLLGWPRRWHESEVFRWNSGTGSWSWMVNASKIRVWLASGRSSRLRKKRSSDVHSEWPLSRVQLTVRVVLTRITGYSGEISVKEQHEKWIDEHSGHNPPSQIPANPGYGTSMHSWPHSSCLLNQRNVLSWG